MRYRWSRRASAVALLLACLVAPSACTTASSRPVAAGPPGPVATAVPLEQVASVRTTLHTLVASGQVPGVVVVLRHGRSTEVLTAGKADTATGARMTPGQRFHTASMTKPMVAAVVMQLVHEGRLTLGDTVERWLPGLVRGGRLITVEELLSHTSGLAEYNDVPAAWPILKHPPVRQRALVAAAARAPRRFAPGAGQEYSNTNFAVLGLVVERATGLRLETVLDRRIFVPLGMASASLRASRVDDEPLAHGYVDGTDATGWDLTWGWAAAGLVSDAPDVDRFFAALFTGELLPRDLVDEMATPAAGDLGAWSGYGLGLAELTTRCGPAVGHSGVVDGFVSAAYTLRRTGNAVVLMVNTDRDLISGVLRDLLETGLCGPP